MYIDTLFHGPLDPTSLLSITKNVMHLMTDLLIRLDLLILAPHDFYSHDPHLKTLPRL